MAPVLVMAVLVTFLTAGSGAVPGTANRVADSPRASQSAPATGWPSVTIAKNDSHGAVTPPIDVAAYEACLTAPPSNTPQPIVTSLGGWSDVSKLGEAEAPGFPVPASASGAPPAGGFVSGGATAGGHNYTCSRAVVNLDYKGQREFPPVRATFAAFGFEPVTATAYLLQDDGVPVTAVDAMNIDPPIGSQGGPNTAVATASVSLRLADVSVNGTPVDVGGDCRTVGPLTSPGSPVDPGMLVLAGGNQPGDPQPAYNLTQGGALAGAADIPSFTGCVTPAGENLDALLDATVSGPDNYVQMEQGPACNSTFSGAQTNTCADALDPWPGPLWSVTGGGSYAGAGDSPLTFTGGAAPTGSGVIITCTDSSVAGTIPDAVGPPRGAQLSFAWTSISGCTGTLYTKVLKKITVSPYGTWSIKMTSTADPVFSAYHPDTGMSMGSAFGVTLEMDGTGLPGTTSSCGLQTYGTPGLAYSDASAELSVGNLGGGLTFGGPLIVVSSNCTAAGVVVGSPLPITATYTLNRHIKITSP